jgi:hypothetical protein
MDSRKFLILGAVAVLLLIAALWFGAQRQPERGDEGRQALLPTLAERVNAVSGLRVIGAGDQLLWEARREGESWVLANRGGYPADFGRLRELLLKLSRAQVIEAKTANPALYDRLGVQDVAAADAEGLKVEVLGIEPPLALIIGRANPQSNGNFVRRADEAQSWLVDTALPIQREPAQWLQRELSQLPVSRVQRVEIVRGDGDRVELVRSDEPGSDFRIGNVPRGREPGIAYLADSTAALLSDLSLDEVAPATEQPMPEDEAELSRARFELEDGLVYRLDAWRDEERTYVQIAVELDEARAREAVAAAQARLRADWEAQQAALDASPQEGEAAENAGEGEAVADADGDAGEAIAPAAPLAVTDPEADADARLAELAAEHEAANARYAGWTFTLPSHKASNFNRRLSAYLKEAD